ncbi:hypothetical protein [Guptibacillus hwajinpoensis]|uniref:hypothetical protein n=1 Tax=Guptibacillus hwajinpoensis TaxID=208199 RepID=UPI0024B32CC8|nr:hypothetical protein [Pseudalkalibacillus hwajinpoensis]
MLQEISGEWKQIVSDESYPSGFRFVHKNSIPYHLDGNILTVLIEEKVYKENYRNANLLRLSKNIKNVTGKDIECIYGLNKRETDITVSSNMLSESVEFAVNSLDYMTQNDFQQFELKRSMEDYLIDTIRGKIAEYVFKEFFENIEKSYSIEIDNKIYKSTIVTDNGNDLESLIKNGNDRYLNNFKVDIKGSKTESQWLLIEDSKAVSDVYVFVKIEFEEEHFFGENMVDKKSLTFQNYRENLIKIILNKFSNNKYYGKVSGFAYMTDIVSNGDKIPYNNGTKFPTNNG